MKWLASTYAWMKRLRHHKFHHSHSTCSKMPLTPRSFPNHLFCETCSNNKRGRPASSCVPFQECRLWWRASHVLRQGCKINIKFRSSKNTLTLRESGIRIKIPTAIPLLVLSGNEVFGNDTTALICLFKWGGQRVAYKQCEE